MLPLAHSAVISLSDSAAEDRIFLGTQTHCMELSIVGQNTTICIIACGIFGVDVSSAVL